MKSSNNFTRLLCAFTFLTVSITLQAVRVFDLRCEMMQNPWGVDNTTPALSWKIAADHNGIKQQAYQILAASSPELVTEEKADLWNTGKVESEQSIWIKYGGKQLSSGSVVYWKLRAWDETGAQSSWSATGRFSVGLLKPSDWKGKFIGMARADTTASPMLRKTFNISSKPQQAFLHICTLGYHEIYINGKAISNDVLCPSVVEFAKRYRSMSYDIRSFLQEGRNDIVVWLGKAWYDASVKGVIGKGPYTKAQIDILEGGNWRTLLSTDCTWKARTSGYYFPGSWGRVKFEGENVNANELLPDLTSATLDKATWQNAIEAAVPERPITPMMCEPNKIQEKIRPVNISNFTRKIWMIDMGKSVVGWAKIKFGQLRKGQKIDISYCDMLGLNGDFEAGVFTDHYTASGEGSEIFCNKFNYHAFRYIKITGLDEMPDLDDITAYSIYTGYDTKSSFVCNDDDINAINHMVHYTFKCLTQSGYMVDCPHLERQGYGGDGNASILAAQTMYELYPLYVNWIQAYGDAQEENGDLPHAAPVSNRCGGGPFWCVFMANAPWQTYLQYGDKDILAEYYPNMQRFAQFAESYMENGLVTLNNRWPNTARRHWFLGDWALPNEEHQLHPESIDEVNSCAMSWCYDIMAKVAGVLGKTQDRKMYARKHAEINERIHKTYFNASKNTYANDLQLDMAFPLFVGATPENLQKQANKSLKDLTYNRFEGHFFTGLVGIPILTQWLTRAGEAQMMYDMLKQRSFPGYLYMIENNATTTWEHWNARRSRIHNCYNGIGSWFYQALGGILPDEAQPAYKHFFIKPQMVDGITFVRTSKPTPYGNINIDWTKSEKTFDLKVEIPAGTTATVEVPFKAVSAEIPPLKLVRYGIVYDEKQRDRRTDTPSTQYDPSKPIELESGKYRIIYHLK